MNSKAIAKEKVIKVKQAFDAFERDIVVNGTHIRLKSVFYGKIPLEKALGNIAMRKISASQITREKQ
jgi:hypothetical protein